MTDSLELPELLQRRRLLTRGVAVAGAAAGAVALTAMGAKPASATDGQTLEQGGTYTGGTTTTLEGGNLSTPALRLTNAAGPALELTSVGDDFDGDLEPGELVAIEDRLLVGARDSLGNYTTALATVGDLNSLYLPYVFPTFRLVDTRSKNGLRNVLSVGGGGLDSEGRLRSRSYVDVAIDPADQDFDVSAAFLNLSSTGSTSDGFLVAYPPGNRPAGATVNFQKGAAATSSGLAALGVVKRAFAVRVYTSATTHLIVDLTGELVAGVPGPQAPALVRTTARSARRSAARRIRSRTPQGRR